MMFNSKFVRSERAQIITLAGVIIALTIVLLAIVINTAAISGQRAITQEVDDAHYVFKNVRDVYGDVLRQVSSDGGDPFDNSRLTSAELNITRMCNAHGFSVLFKDKIYDGFNATAKIIFSDGETTYRDNVVYVLRVVPVTLTWDSGDLELDTFTTRKWIKYEVYTYFLDIPNESAIQEIDVKVNVTEWEEQGKVDTLSARDNNEQIGNGVSTGMTGTYWFNSTDTSWLRPQENNTVTIGVAKNDKLDVISWDVVEVYVKYMLP